MMWQFARGAVLSVVLMLTAALMFVVWTLGTGDFWRIFT